MLIISLKHKQNYFFILYISLLLYSCSSSSFYQRQYLKGKYVDKISKSNKSILINANDFQLDESLLKAEVVDNCAHTKHSYISQISSTDNIQKSINTDSLNQAKRIVQINKPIIDDVSVVTIKRNSLTNHPVINNKSDKEIKNSWRLLGQSLLMLIISVFKFLILSIILLDFVIGVGFNFYLLFLLIPNIFLFPLYGYLLYKFLNNLSYVSNFKFKHKLIFVISFIIFLSSFIIAIINIVLQIILIKLLVSVMLSSFI